MIKNYRVINSTKELPISLVALKEYLVFIDPTDTTEDEYLTDLMRISIKFIEDYTGKDLTFKKYYAYTNTFTTTDIRFILDGMKIKKCPVKNIDKIQYIDINNGQTIIPSNDYYLIPNMDYYSYVNFSEYPEVKDIFNSIQLTFNAGYGFNIDEISRLEDVVTVKTVEDNFLEAGQKILISNINEAIFNGIFVINTVIDEKTFTYNVIVPTDKEDNFTEDGTGDFMVVNNIPDIFLLAIKRLVLYLYENKGDCPNSDIMAYLDEFLFSEQIMEFGIYEL